MTLDRVVKVCQVSNTSINKICEIKTYLSTVEKFQFLKEYYDVVEQHLKDYIGYEEFIKLIFFNLMIVKKYTNIELELTYEEFDKLQQYGVIGSIAAQIGADYELMMSLIKMKDIKE